MRFSSLKWVSSVGLLALLLNGQVHAQFSPTPIRPVVSPYLNLFRGNSNSLTLNYFGLVQPQQQFFGATAQLQQQFSGFQQQYSADQLAAQAQAKPGALPPTGHGFGFMTQSRYFLNVGRGGSGGGFGGRPGGGGGIGGLAGPGTGVGTRPLGGSTGAPSGLGIGIGGGGLR